MKDFRYFVEGRQFVMYTDHKPLTKAIVSKQNVVLAKLVI